jgi:hypothetical protein
MRLSILALSLATLCIPGVALAQSNTTPRPIDPTPAPSADCTTPDCNAMRSQQDNLNNNSGTPAAPNSLGDQNRGTSSGSGTLPPTTPDDSLGGNSSRGLDSGGNDGGLGGGSLGGSSSGGGM